MFSFLASALLIWFFWRQLLAMAVLALCVIVPLGVAVVTFTVTGSGFGAMVAAAVAAFVCCSLVSEAAA